MIYKILYWLPLLILPIFNIFIALVTKQFISPSLPFIIGAVAEELFYRWFLLKHIFLPRMKPVFAIILVSVVFAAMHLFNLQAGQPPGPTLVQVFFAFCFSVWAGAVVWKTGRILIPLAAHVLLNAAALPENSEWMTVLAGVIVLTAAVLLLKEEEKQP